MCLGTSSGCLEHWYWHYIQRIVTVPGHHYHCIWSIRVSSQNQCAWSIKVSFYESLCQEFIVMNHSAWSTCAGPVYMEHMFLVLNRCMWRKYVSSPVSVYILSMNYVFSPVSVYVEYMISSSVSLGTKHELLVQYQCLYSIRRSSPVSVCTEP